LFTYKGLDENFKFLVLEIKKQLEITRKALGKNNPRYLEKVKSSGDYVDNLKTIIARKSYAQITQISGEDKKMIDCMMSINSISSNLEKIGDYCENIIKQIYYFNDKTFLAKYNYQEYFKIILKAVNLIAESFLNSNIQQALRICRTEFVIDDLYLNDFKEIMKNLEVSKKDQPDLITSIFILRYLERIGDALLNTGEAIISSVVGTRLKINEYDALQSSLPHNTQNFNVESIGVETRSGCKIEKVKNISSSSEWQEVIFKEGRAKKLREEKENLTHWDKIFSGLTPRIYGFESRGETASLLMEYRQGKNFQEIILSNSRRQTSEALDRIIETITNIWEKTLKKEKGKTNFMEQLLKRVSDVYAIHPSFDKKEIAIGSLVKPSLNNLVISAKKIEKNLQSPFTVMIHGDFNNDNLLYDYEKNRVSLIDIHRSSQADYTQDISVFLVSNFRMPVFNSKNRNLINKVILDFYEFVTSFAQQKGDSTFEARLSLGLARSFFTSTRFVLNKKFAKTMYLRSLHLLEGLNKHYQGDWENFKFDKEILLYN